MNIEFTPRQEKVLAFVKSYIEHHEFSPSYNEIAEAIGYGAIGRAKEDLDYLEEVGLITRDKYVSRSIRLVNKPESVSYRGQIAAGTPLLAEEDAQDFDLTALFANGNEVLTMADHSYQHSAPGDLVVVDEYGNEIAMIRKY